MHNQNNDNNNYRDTNYTATEVHHHHHHRHVYCTSGLSGEQVGMCGGKGHHASAIICGPHSEKVKTCKVQHFCPQQYPQHQKPNAITNVTVLMLILQRNLSNNWKTALLRSEPIRYRRQNFHNTWWLTVGWHLMPLLAQLHYTVPCEDYSLLKIFIWYRKWEICHWWLTYKHKCWLSDIKCLCIIVLLQKRVIYCIFYNYTVQVVRCQQTNTWGRMHDAVVS